MQNQIRHLLWATYVTIKTLFLRLLPQSKQLPCGIKRILMYHEIQLKDVKSFSKQIEYLTSRYKIVPLNDLMTKWSTYQTDENVISITFDDAYASVYNQAAPILDRYRIKPCIFVPVGFIENVDYKGYIKNNLKINLQDQPMNWNQLQDLLNRGYELGSHTWNHVDCGRENIDFNQEFKQSKGTLEKRLGKTVSYFAFPFGRRPNMSEQSIQAAKDSGYQKVFSALRGPIHIQDFVISRVYANPKWDCWTLDCMLKGSFDVI